MHYPSWFEAIRYIKAKNKTHTVLFTTNGTCINRNIDKLINSGVDKVIWSWRPEARFTEETKARLKEWDKFTVRLIEGEHPPEAFSEYRSWPHVEVRRKHNYGGNIETSEKMPTSRFPCYHLWLAPAVAWNGNILICCADPHQKEIIGNVKETSVSEAFKRMESIRQAHLRGEYSGICEKCDVWRAYPDMFFEWQKTAS